MLKKDKNKSSQITKKRVHWDESVEDNARMPKHKRQRLSHIERKAKPSRPKLSISLVKKHFKESTYDQLQEIFDMHSSTSITKLFTLDNYELFSYAASMHNIEALNFIIRTAPQKTIFHDMLHHWNLFPFGCFLIYTRTLQEHGKLDHQRRIDGFKIFLKIDSEAVQEAFKNHIAKISEKDPVKESLKNDFNIALTQLQEEGIIPVHEVEESSTEEKSNLLQNDLLKHLDTNSEALTFQTTTSLTAGYPKNTQNIQNTPGLAEIIQSSTSSIDSLEKKVNSNSPQII